MTKVYQTNVSEVLNPINAVMPKKDNGHYKFIDSKDIIKTLENHNFELKNVSYGNPRNKENKGFQKHIMIFENDNMVIDGDNKLQLLVTNSHNTATSLQFNIGVFRAICANGLIVGNSIFEERINHVGNINQKIIETTGYAIETMPTITEQVKLLKSIDKVDANHLINFAKQSIDERLRNINDIINVRFNDVIRVRRSGDKNQDLFTKFNIIQENIIKGGIRYQTRKENDKGVELKNNTTRKIKSLDENKHLNQLMWNNIMEIANAA